MSKLLDRVFLLIWLGIWISICLTNDRDVILKAFDL